MSFRKQRISISLIESGLILPGLEAIVNGIAGARLGSYPFARLDFLIHSQAKSIYKNQKFDEAIAAQLLALRNKLKNAPSRKKLRLGALTSPYTSSAYGSHS